MRVAVLSGGGAAGAYHIGVLQELSKAGITFDAYCGVSIGAVISALCVANEGYVEAFSEDFLNLKSKQIYRKGWGWPFNIIWRKSIYDLKPTRKLLEQHAPFEKIVNSSKELLVGATNIESGKFDVWEGTELTIHDAIIASASVPVMFPPVRIDGVDYIDGGVQDNLPINHTAFYGPTEVFAINCGPVKPSIRQKPTTILDIAARSLELIRVEQFKNDLSDGQNALSKARLNFISPDKEPVENLLKFEPGELHNAFTLGVEDACRFLETYALPH